MAYREVRAIWMRWGGRIWRCVTCSGGGMHDVMRYVLLACSSVWSWWVLPGFGMNGE